MNGTNALTRALNDYSDSLDRCRKSAATIDASDLAPIGTVGRASTDVGNHRAQYLQGFRDWSYVAINAIAQRIAGQPLYVGRQLRPASRRSKSFLDSVKPLDSHPLLAAINDPNQIMVRWSLIFSTIASLKLTGKSFWLLTDSKRGQRYDLWPIPASWMEPFGSLHQKWLMRPGGRGDQLCVDGERVAYFHFPDPGNPFTTVSPLQTQAAAIDSDNQLQRSQARAFANGLNPSMILTAGTYDGSPSSPTVRLNDHQKKQLIDAIRAWNGGVENAGAPLILDALIKDAKPFSILPKEMDWLESGKQIKARIFQAFGVNPLNVGEIEGANRAQATVAEELFCANVLNPLAELIGQVLTGWLPAMFGDEGLIVYFEPFRAHDPELTLKEWDLGLKNGCVTRNEYRQQILGIQPMDGGDKALVPFTMVSANE